MRRNDGLQQKTSTARHVITNEKPRHRRQKDNIFKNFLLASVRGDRILTMITIISSQTIIHVYSITAVTHPSVKTQMQETLSPGLMAE